MKTLIASALLAVATLSAGAASATQAWVTPGITLNARSGPSTHYDVLGKFTPCTPVHVVGWHSGWSKVAFNGHYYWVSAKYLQGQSCQPAYHAPQPKAPKAHSGYRHY